MAERQSKGDILALEEELEREREDASRTFEDVQRRLKRAGSEPGVQAETESRLVEQSRQIQEELEALSPLKPLHRGDHPDHQQGDEQDQADVLDRPLSALAVKRAKAPPGAGEDFWHLDYLLWARLAEIVGRPGKPDQPWMWRKPIGSVPSPATAPFSD